MGHNPHAAWSVSRLKLRNPAKKQAPCPRCAVFCANCFQPNSRSATCGRAPGRQTIHTDPRGCQTPPLSRTSNTPHPCGKTTFVRFGLSVLTRTLTSVQPLLSTPNLIGHYCPILTQSPAPPDTATIANRFGVGASQVSSQLLRYITPPHSKSNHRYAYPMFWFQGFEIPKQFPYPV
jgi:hypothetical protein